jgi:hypothetical protein
VPRSKSKAGAPLIETRGQLGGGGGFTCNWGGTAVEQDVVG